MKINNKFKKYKPLKIDIQGKHLFIQSNTTFILKLCNSEIRLL